MSAAAARAVAERYIAWLNDAPVEHPDVADALFAADFTWTEAPTRFSRRSRGGDRAVLMAALGEAGSMLAEERITPTVITATAERVVIEVRWEGRPRGAEAWLIASGVTVLELRGDRITAARDYLCFES